MSNIRLGSITTIQQFCSKYFSPNPNREITHKVYDSLIKSLLKLHQISAQIESAKIGLCDTDYHSI